MNENKDRGATIDNEVQRIADALARDAEHHYRFTSTSRYQVVKTTMTDVLRDLVPLIPLLTAIYNERRCDALEADHIAELLDTLNR